MTFKNTFTCKGCKTEYHTKERRDKCMKQHKMSPEKLKSIEEYQKRGLENFKKVFG